MSVVIEKYRGWDISFDTDKESFFVESDEWDQKKEKRSFAACKSFVDDFLKANSEFKPVRIQHIEDGREVMLVGIRKDGFFVYLDGDEKKQLSKYSERSYVKFNPDNTPIFIEIAKIKAQKRSLQQSLDALEKQVTGESLKSIRDQFLVQ